MREAETIERVTTAVSSTLRGSTVNESTERYYSKLLPSPVGVLKLVASDAGLAAILWENDDPRRVRLNSVIEDENHPILLETERQLGEYFAGRRRSFSLPLDFKGTPFQRRVWSALLTIPYGETRTYADVARAIGQPRAVRAVANACASNPVALAIPCHRVIGKDGAIAGYRWGAPRKEVLLETERAHRESDKVA